MESYFTNSYINLLLFYIFLEQEKQTIIRIKSIMLVCIHGFITDYINKLKMGRNNKDCAVYLTKRRLTVVPVIRHVLSPTCP